MNSNIDDLSLAALPGAEPASDHVVHAARFAPLPEIKATSRAANPIDFLFDITLQISVELGRAEMSVRDITEMGLGSVIELNKLAGEPVDIMVNGKPIARGEVVVVDEMFGVRVIDIISPYERINSLK